MCTVRCATATTERGRSDPEARSGVVLEKGSRKGEYFTALVVRRILV